LLHIHGKRRKDRYVPLPDATLTLLRSAWRTRRIPRWLSPTGTRSGVAPRNDPAHGAHLARQPPERLRSRGEAEWDQQTRARPHPPSQLRDASPRSGVNLRLIQEYLGHTSPQTTAIYTHLTRELRDAALEPINGLMARI
jgi:integrase/recombinase XerD